MKGGCERNENAQVAEVKKFCNMREYTREGGEKKQSKSNVSWQAEQSSAADEEEQRETEAESAPHFTLFVVVVAVQMEVGGREVEPIRGAKWNLCRSMGDFVYCPFAAC